MENIKIRFAALSDAAALLEIYKPYAEETAITFEYEAPSLEEFSSRINNILPKYPYLVAESDGQLLGFAYAGAFRSRPAYAWAVETTIYIRRDQKRCGLGRKLYDALEKVLSEQNILNLNACIAWPGEEPDLYLTHDSVEFHSKMGYRPVGEFVQCGYKFGRWYSMVWMEKHIGPHLPCPAPVIPVREVRQTVAEKYGIL